MIECLILGDSIAVGTGLYRPECKVLVQQGITSKGWNMSNVKSTLDANTVVISLGSNDYKHLNTEIELVALRTHVNSDQVFWIVPAIKPEKQELVKKIARHFGDTFVTIPELSPDKVHPTYRGYRQLGVLTK